MGGVNCDGIRIRGARICHVILNTVNTKKLFPFNLTDYGFNFLVICFAAGKKKKIYIYIYQNNKVSQASRVLLGPSPQSLVETVIFNV